MRAAVDLHQASGTCKTCERLREGSYKATALAMLVAMNVFAPLCLVLLSGTLNAAELGRLLLAPADRLIVQRARTQAIADLARPANQPGLLDDELLPAATTAAGQSLTLNGWVVRAGNRSTVWVNGEPFYRFDQQGATRKALVDRGLIASTGEANGQTGALKLKPGQTLHPGQGQEVDLLPQGAFKASRGAQSSPTIAAPLKR